ncbi:S41 family peptidase [Gorillibacterium massiliense]|uniref:S41 family peptidase n=1 Tax=Gorillibacterium massiliense TaxID=1280390 RepID=UPI000594B784|nr:S41 family peptidase [Gorillibacterium massiliense]
MKKTILAALCAAALLVAPLPTPAMASTASGDKINDVLEILHSYHLQGPSEDDLTRAAIQGMIDSLNDPYTEYFSEDEAQQFFNMLDASEYRIGIQVDTSGTDLTIIDVLADSPAEKAGIKIGDVLLTVNGTAVNADNFNELFDKASAQKEDSVVTLKLRRGTDTMTLNVPFVKIDDPVTSSQYLSGGIGYLSLAIFNERSAQEFTDKLAALKKQGIHSLIVDLRSNGGGEVEAAQKIAANFIPNGAFMYTKDQNGVETKSEITGGASVDFPVYILVNHYTASASEMLAGALQDYGVAKVIGTQTYGKGVMQQFYSVQSADWMIKVTTNEYFTPKHRKVDHIGIKPDVTTSDDATMQLFEGLRQGGVKQFKVTLSNSGTSINELTFADTIPVVRKNGKVYVLSRLAAAITGSKLEWKEGGADSHVLLSSSGVSRDFSLKKGEAILDGGYSYLEAGKIMTGFPSFGWKDDAGKLVLTYGAN